MAVSIRLVMAVVLRGLEEVVWLVVAVDIALVQACQMVMGIMFALGRR